MSKENLSERFDELLRHTAIQSYSTLAAQVKYDEGSWALIEQSLEQEKNVLLRKQKLQTAGVLTATLILGLMVFFLSREV